jgi:hypothetical protein
MVKREKIRKKVMQKLKKTKDTIEEKSRKLIMRFTFSCFSYSLWVRELYDAGRIPQKNYNGKIILLFKA